jgi:hypothetical protein
MRKNCLTGEPSCPNIISNGHLYIPPNNKSLWALQEIENKMAKQKTDINSTIDKSMELTQKSAKLALKGAVQTAELSESYLQGVYKAGYDANVDALKVAKGYWDATTEIRQDWVKLFAETGENVIDATAKMQIPTPKDAMDYGTDVFNSISKTVQGFIPQAKN